LLKLAHLIVIHLLVVRPFGVAMLVRRCGSSTCRLLWMSALANLLSSGFTAVTIMLFPPVEATAAV
jgi:hypothetical protein